MRHTVPIYLFIVHIFSVVCVFGQNVPFAQNGEIESIKKEAVHIIAIGTEARLYTLNPETRSKERELLNRQDLKGFEIKSETEVDNTAWGQLKLILLNKINYADPYIKRSCQFSPDYALVVNAKKEGELIILYSRSCKKLLFSQTRGRQYSSSDTFRELNEEGYIQLEKLIAEIENVFSDFEGYQKDSIKFTEEDQIQDQLLVLNHLLKKREYDGIRTMFQDRTLTIIDTIINVRGKIDRIELRFRKNRLFDDEKILTADTAHFDFDEVYKLMESNLLKINIAPIRAEVIEKLPPHIISKAQENDYYLKRIEEIIIKNPTLRKRYSVEKYLKYEKDRQITNVNDQILCRIKFIEFLKTRR